VATSANRYALWRQLAGWVAAYVLVLHAFVAALAPPHIAGHGIGDEASGFIFCASDVGDSVPAQRLTDATDALAGLARGLREISRG